MNGEPLTPVKERSMVDVESSTPSETFFIHYFSSVDVRSALDGLKQEIRRELQCDDLMCREEICETVDRWFPVFRGE